MKKPFSPPLRTRAVNQSLERRVPQEAEFKSRKCREPRGTQGSQDFQGSQRPVKPGPCDKPCFAYILVHAIEQRMVTRDEFALRKPYYFAVRILGGIFHQFTKRKRKYDGRRVELVPDYDPDNCERISALAH